MRALRALDEGILANMSAVFDERYSHTGRPSIPPEQVPFQRVLEWGYWCYWYGSEHECDAAWLDGRIESMGYQ